MRATSWIVMAAIIGLGNPAAGRAGCNECNRGPAAGPAAAWALDAGACASPPGYSLTPGCCEHSRHCCDNAWAGYCEHRAKLDAFWARVGTPKPHCRPTACRQMPVPPCAGCPAAAVEQMPVSPLPADSPLLPPVPQPEKPR